ncbi:DUF3077 domain-containing protein [Pseudomonas kairouanensis]|uniref:DUF3077 domain-containing protein n=1 Tax=Pseudomonas kairouanensis TaxID=2293832 RepID=A0A4Z0ANS0_9PSED|nr:DUF3077 domain-containing protein [Pseudomonas kairouanensis]TFY88446.1 DUF3077 domain-containing protein [Pseudomonas kairouanensis]
MTKVKSNPPHNFFITHPELSFEDALAYASDLLHCAEALGQSPKAAGYLVEMAKVMVDRSLECMSPS